MSIFDDFHGKSFLLVDKVMSSLGRMSSLFIDEWEWLGYIQLQIIFGENSVLNLRHARLLVFMADHKSQFAPWELLVHDVTRSFYLVSFQNSRSIQCAWYEILLMEAKSKDLKETHGVAIIVQFSMRSPTPMPLAPLAYFTRTEGSRKAEVCSQIMTPLQHGPWGAVTVGKKWPSREEKKGVNCALFKSPSIRPITSKQIVVPSARSVTKIMLLIIPQTMGLRNFWRYRGNVKYTILIGSSSSNFQLFHDLEVQSVTHSRVSFGSVGIHASSVTVTRSHGSREVQVSPQMHPVVFLVFAHFHHLCQHHRSRWSPQTQNVLARNVSFCRFVDRRVQYMALVRRLLGVLREQSHLHRRPFCCRGHCRPKASGHRVSVVEDG